MYCPDAVEVEYARLTFDPYATTFSSDEDAGDTGRDTGLCPVRESHYGVLLQFGLNTTFALLPTGFDVGAFGMGGRRGLWRRSK